MKDFLDQMIARHRRKRKEEEAKLEKEKAAVRYIADLQERADKRDHLIEIRTQFDGERFRWLADPENFTTAEEWAWEDIAQLRRLIDAEFMKEANRASPS